MMSNIVTDILNIIMSERNPQTMHAAFILADKPAFSN
jgi:hypothetical protein